MMAGSRDLRKIQIGSETTAGTAVAATTIWRGMGTIKDDREIIFPEEDVGIMGGTTRSALISQQGQLSMESVGATFEQLPYLLDAGVKTVSGVADNGGSNYIYTYVASTAAQNTIKTYTLEGGDDQQAEEFDYCFVQNISLTGEGQGQLMMAAEWIGREVTNTTFTTSLSIPSVEDIIFNSGKLYIDDSGGTIGDTQVSGLLRTATLNWVTGLIPYWTVDGSLDFSSHKFAGRTEDIVLNMTYEHIAGAVTEKAKYRSKDVRLIRLLFEGSDFETAGTIYSKHTLIIDLAGIIEDWEALGEVDGNDVVGLTFRARYSSTDSLKAEVVISNELSALP